MPATSVFLYGHLPSAGIPFCLAKLGEPWVVLRRDISYASLIPTHHAWETWLLYQADQTSERKKVHHLVALSGVAADNWDTSCTGFSVILSKTYNPDTLKPKGHTRSKTATKGNTRTSSLDPSTVAQAWYLSTRKAGVPTN